MTTDASTTYASENLKQHSAVTDVFTAERYAQFARHLSRQAGTILDVGCSTGRGGTVLKSLCNQWQIVGLDCVPERLAQLPTAYSSSILGLSTSIPCPDQTFDAIVAGEFLEHLYPRDVDPTLCEFQRVLKVGGRLLLTTPNPYYLKNWLKGLSVYSVGHLTQHPPRVLRLRLLLHGFRHVRLSGSGKVSRYLGCRFPILAAYGSYLVRGVKV